MTPDPGSKGTIFSAGASDPVEAFFAERYNLDGIAKPHGYASLAESCDGTGRGDKELLFDSKEIGVVVVVRDQGAAAEFTT